MLNRRILRIKAFKALYSSVILGESGAQTSLQAALSDLEVSCESVRDLYILMMGLVSPLTSVAAMRIEAAGRKLRKSEADLNPNRKFADNSLAKLLDEDIDFQKIWKKKKYSWDQYDIVLKKIFDAVSAREYFQTYMAKPSTSLAEDCRLFTRIFEDEILEAEGLEEILESMNIWWNDDLAYALTWCCKTFKSLAQTGRWEMPPLYQSDLLAAQKPDVESDKAFVTKLLRCAYESYPEYSDLISDSVPNFDKERLVATDVCIMVCCLAEAVNFPTIPVKVSINEYVEISKYYGTPKSSVFVNGILDRTINRFIAEGIIKK